MTCSSRSAARLALAVFVLAPLAPGVRAQSAPLDPAVPVPKFTTSADADTVRFVAMGDFGTGGADQRAVARAVRAVCAARGCAFVLGLGDLIYEHGVDSPADAQFAAKFEEPYADLPLPFYQALGNHDNSGPHGDGADNIKGNAEVAYHYRPVGPGERPSDKWRMPSRYYTFQHGRVAQFYALDTTPLQYADPRWAGSNPRYREDQTAWLLRERAASTARWHVAFAHHPYLSNGNHGNAGRYEESPGWGWGVQALIEEGVCGEMSAYFAGHDHSLQWLRAPTGCEGTEIVVSGAGGKSRELTHPDRNPVFFQRGGIRGFVWMELTPKAMRGVVYDDAGAVLFERTVLATAELPVELTAFTAASDGAGVLLRWATASETNNAGFHVEARRAADDARAWAEVAFVPGAGTTAEPHAYAHRAADLAPGAYRFRLRQTDADGTAAYSPEIEAAVALDAALVLLPPAPNPARGASTVRFALRDAGPARLTLHDALGRETAVLFDADAPAGTTVDARLDGGALAPGVYVLRLTTRAGTATRRAVVAR